MHIVSVPIDYRVFSSPIQGAFGSVFGLVCLRVFGCFRPFFLKRPYNWLSSRVAIQAMRYPHNLANNDAPGKGLNMSVILSSQHCDRISLMFD